MVWYAVYGSNLLKRRFMCYLEGKPPTENAVPPEKFEARSDILGDVRYTLPFELYFARKESRAWGNGGVAYLGTWSDASFRTLGRAYLLTLPQLNHVVRWENGGDQPVDIPERSLRGDQTEIKGVKLYPVLLLRPPLHHITVVTITRPPKNSDCNPPSLHYQGIMLLGLYETYPEIPSAELVQYLRAAAHNTPSSLS